ncbi:hypothetical protein BDF21DRAFT_399733 [Thamnidium elegans]|nr:hypothetical protein BDF21DRAFT_399733 [Thamnidium elegans]
MIMQKKVIVGTLNSILNYDTSMKIYHLRNSFLNFKEENRYDVCANESYILISCQYHYFAYHSTAFKRIFLIQRLMPALDIVQPTINIDFNTVGSQFVGLNQVEDGNNDNDNDNDNTNEDIHIDTNNINNELSSNLLEPQNLLSINTTYENDDDYVAADTLNKAIIDFKMVLTIEM